MKPLTKETLASIEKTGCVVSLFSGFGANTIGYEWAGFRVALAVDKNNDVTTIYQKNFPDIPVLKQDIMQIHGQTIADQYQLPEIDILDAAMPHQWAGRPVKLSTSLMLDVLRLTREWRPKVVVITMDKRWYMGKWRIMMNEIAEWFMDIDYYPDIEVLNGRFYEVPQDQERTVLIATRKDLFFKPVFPEAVNRLVTTKDVIGDLVDVPVDVRTNPLRKNYASQYFYPGITENQIEDMIDTLPFRIQSQLYVRDRWNAPYYELKRHLTRPIHPTKDRILSIWEAMRLQYFPDDFILSPNLSLNWQKIAGATSPQLIKHIATTIKTELLELPKTK